MNSKKLSKVSIIVPAYNEEGNIGETIKRLGKVFKKDIEIIIVDDGSRDRTVEEANQSIKKMRMDNIAKVVSHPENKGKGAAVRTGIQHCKGKIIVIEDADLTTVPETIPLLLDAMVDGIDIVYGARLLQEAGAMPIMNRIGNFILALVARVLLDVKIKDIMSGQKAFRSKVFERVKITENSWPDIEIAVKAAKAGFKTIEVPITYLSRKAGDVKMQRITTGLKSIYDLIMWSIFKRKSD